MLILFCVKFKTQFNSNIFKRVHQWKKRLLDILEFYIFWFTAAIVEFCDKKKPLFLLGLLSHTDTYTRSAALYVLDVAVFPNLKSLSNFKIWTLDFFIRTNFFHIFFDIWIKCTHSSMIKWYIYRILLLGTAIAMCVYRI